MFHFATNIYRNTSISADDIIQDLFLNIWENKRLKFNGLINIKAYIFISIKNSFKDYIKHKKHIDKHRYSTILDNDYFVSQIVEAEITSFLDIAIDILPEECRKVFVEYLNGFDVKEIAAKLNKSEFTVYKQKKNAIEILKTKLPKNKLVILLLILKIISVQ